MIGGTMRLAADVKTGDRVTLDMTDTGIVEDILDLGDGSMHVLLCDRDNFLRWFVINPLGLVFVRDKE